SLEDKLAGLGLTEHERSYRPHVALARHAKHSHLPEPSAMAWHVNAFCLAESAPSPSGRYRILHTYLAAPRPGA
ncbi:MAG: 2'-5' RNA ligase family protein, partial [Polaromonas sp.]